LAPITVTEDQLFNTVRAPLFRLRGRYLEALKNFFFGLFFSSIYPITPIFGFASFILEYFSVKYILLHHVRKPGSAGINLLPSFLTLISPCSCDWPLLDCSALFEHHPSIIENDNDGTYHFGNFLNGSECFWKIVGMLST